MRRGERPDSREHDDAVLLYAFDLLEVDGEDIRPLPLHARKARLESCSRRRRPASNTNEHVEGKARSSSSTPAAWASEGIVSKHRDGPYRLGPSKTWLKIKNPAAPGVTRFEREDARHSRDMESFRHYHLLEYSE